MQAAEAAKRAEAENAKAAKKAANEEDMDDLDPNQYYERRVRTLAAVKASGGNPYPHKFQISMYLPEFVAKYSSLEADCRRTEETVTLAGISESGNKFELCMPEQERSPVCELSREHRCLTGDAI